MAVFFFEPVVYWEPGVSCRKQIAWQSKVQHETNTARIQKPCYILLISIGKKRNLCSCFSGERRRSISTSSSPVYFSFGTSRDTPAIPHKLIAKLHQLNAWKRLQRSLNCKYTLPNLIGYLRAKIQKTNQAGSVCHPTFPKLIEGGHKKNVSNNIKLICAVTVVVTVVTAVAVVLFLFSPQKQ